MRIVDNLGIVGKAGKVCNAIAVGRKVDCGDMRNVDFGIVNKAGKVGKAGTVAT